MGEEREREREQEGARISKPPGTCVVSYRACRGHRTQRRGVRAPQVGTQAKATETLLAGEGKSAALGSYGQSGGANSTRKTWGALVGETGRSHLTSTVTLGWPGEHSLRLGAVGERRTWECFKAAKETC